MPILTQIGRRWEAWVAEPVRWIDRHAELPPGRVGPGARVTIVLLTAAFVLLAMAYGVLDRAHQLAIVGVLIDAVREIDADAADALARYRPLLRVIVWTIGAFTLYFVVPALVVRRVLGYRLSDFGLTTRGIRKHMWVYAALFLPVALMVLVVAGAPDFQSKYPFYRDPQGWADLLVWEAFYALQFFSLEFFFRGFLLHGVKDRFGHHAIYVMLLPYLMIHFSKPFYESVGAIAAGSILGLLSLRTGSVVGGFFIHVAVAITMDVMALGLRGWP